MTTFPTGGRYCSIITVEMGNARVLERIRASIATAAGGALQKALRQQNTSTIYARFSTCAPICRLPNPLMKSYHEDRAASKGREQKGPIPFCRFGLAN